MDVSAFELDRAPDKIELTVDVVELGRYVKKKRESFRLSLRAVAEQTQVSASTLSRIENGSGVPDTPTLAKLSLWLDVPLGDMIDRSDNRLLSYKLNSQSTPDFVEAHLRADRNLTPEKAQALAQLFRIAYSQFAPVESSPVE